jgi:hypothetical protein
LLKLMAERSVVSDPRSVPSKSGVALGAVIRNPDTPIVDRLLTVGVINRCMQANNAQELPYDVPVPITIAGGQDEDGHYSEASLCSQLGLKQGVIGPALKRVKNYGFVSYEVSRQPIEIVDRNTGELVPAIDPETGKQRWRSVAQFQLRKEPLVALQEFSRYRPAVAADPPDLGKQNRVCPTHGPDAPTVTVTTCAIDGCGAVIDISRKRGRGAFAGLNLNICDSEPGAPATSVDRRSYRAQKSIFSDEEDRPGDDWGATS